MQVLPGSFELRYIAWNCLIFLQFSPESKKKSELFLQKYSKASLRSERPLWKVWARINVYKNTTKMTSELLKSACNQTVIPRSKSHS